MGKRTRAPEPPAAAPFHAPFAKLAGRLGTAAASQTATGTATGTGTGTQTASQTATQTATPLPRGPARAVVRLERKGRGGKEATIVEKLDLSRAEREAWLSRAKKALGCGGALEGDALVLQGDLRERARAWLETQGVRRVTVG